MRTFVDKPQSCVIVIFGASGDLTKRKLIPALFSLFEQNLLPDKFAILGVGRKSFNDDNLRKYVSKNLKKFLNLVKKENPNYQAPNRLIIRIQPDEGILLNFGMKLPGNGFQIKNVGMDFQYSDMSDKPLPDAYERLLLDALSGDATLFIEKILLKHVGHLFNPF